MKMRGILIVLLMVGVTGSALGQEAPKQMTFGSHRDMDPMVAPDGNSFAFSSDRTGDFSIFVYKYSDRGTYQMTQSVSDDRYPSWSPDCKRLLFTSDRTGSGDIYEMATDGSTGYLQLTELKNLEEYASYHPKGKSMVFARSSKRGLVRRQMNVVTVNLGPGAHTPRVLAEGDEPRFSPDGNKIVFVSRRTKNNDIWLMNADGTEQMQLTPHPDDDENPSFSPDGKQIVFASERTGQFNIYCINTDGSDMRQLTSNPADETQPCWSKGGYIYYTRKTGDFMSGIFRIPAPK